jgi:ABC-2 type transport system permease protein
VAWLIPSQQTRGKLAAIALVRWQMIGNSLRTIRGRLELVSRIIMALSIAIAGFGGAVGVAAASWYFTSHAEMEFLSIFLWLVFLFWQLFPVMASAFTETAESSNLLRFPLSYRSYFLIQLVYGSLEPATALGGLWLFGMAVGIGAAKPALFPWAALVLLTFALLNIFLTRMIFSWLERWLAKRRTRELMGLLFFAIIIGVQFIGPITIRLTRHAHPEAASYSNLLLPLERLLPPGLAASALSQPFKAGFAPALAALALLGGYCAVFAWLLGIRVRKQFLGENLSEGLARVKGPKVKIVAQEGWELPGASSGVAAVFQKEFHYLTRSIMMLFNLVMPIAILLIFALAPGNARNDRNFLQDAPDFAFPIGAAYALLLLVNLSFNAFGADHAGVQFYFVSPVPFRQIMFAKNLVHMTIIAVETVAVWIAVCFVFRAPSLEITLATLAGILFATPVNLAVGDLMSLYSPKKVDFSKFGRQRASGLTALASLGTQAVTMGIVALTFLAAHLAGKIWIATLLYLVFAVASIAGYLVVLGKVDALAIQRRESLIEELCRA